MGAALFAALLAVAGQAAAQGPPPQTEPAQPAPKPVEEGSFPKSFKIPGTDLSLSVGGYVKVDFIQDFDAIGDAYEFKVNSIPASGSATAAQSGQTTIHARETRFNLDLRSGGSGGHRFRAFVEGDFFGDKNAFRLRHAFGEYGPLLGGQTWSTFQDISARPLTVDFEGPDGEVFVRQAMIRFTKKFSANWSAAVAAESPTPQFAVPSGLAGSPRSTMPDIPGFVRYQRGKGHVQFAGLVRQIRFDSTGQAADESTAGWGVNATFVLPLGSRDQLLGQFVVGEGVGRYIEGASGQNLDAVLSSSGSLEAVGSQGTSLGVIHQWRPGLKSGAAFSVTRVEDAAGLPSGTIDSLKDVRFNLIWTPYRLVDIASEVLWGERSNKDGSRGDAFRFQFAVTYRIG